MQLYVSPNGSDRAEGTIEAPFKTVQKAVDRAIETQDAYWDGGITILMREGVYPVEKAIDIHISAPLTLKPYPGEKAVLTGGRTIEGVEEGSLNGKRCWTAFLGDVKAGKWYFKSLFANERRCTRAHLPRSDFYWIESTPDPEATMKGELFDGEYSFIVKKEDWQDFRNLSDVEMHVFHYWVDEHMPVTSFDAATRTVTSSRKSIFVLKDDQNPRFAKYRIENIFEGLCEPGDFYLDRSEGRLYYLPHEDETLENTRLTAPCADQLLNIHDSTDVRIEGLAMRCTDWTLPERIGHSFQSIDDGTPYAASPQAASNLPGAIQFTHCKRCAVMDCDIRNVGMYAINLAYACASMQICGNTIHDMGAGGVKLDGAYAEEPKAEQTHHVDVSDNDIGYGGRVFLSGIGVVSLNAHHNRITHNHIHDLYYSGVSCGWIWGYTESSSNHNAIEYNHIHTLGHGILSDMGGIYTLSVQPGTTVRNNLIYDIEKSNYGGWAIYPDEGSSHIVIENNVCYNTSSSCFHQHYGRENIIRNNIFAFGREGIITYTRSEPHNGLTFERNILLSKGQPFYVGNGIGNMHADMNLFWDMEGKPAQYIRGDFYRHDLQPLEALKEKGYDLFSIVADPEFADPENGDFTLSEDSPAYLIGFKPIDLSTVGPRK